MTVNIDAELTICCPCEVAADRAAKLFVRFVGFPNRGQVTQEVGHQLSAIEDTPGSAAPPDPRSLWSRRMALRKGMHPTGAD